MGSSSTTEPLVATAAFRRLAEAIDPCLSGTEAADLIADFRCAARAEVLREAAVELDGIADAVEARVAEHFGAASGIGPGSAEMVREAARSLLRMARAAAAAGGDVS